MPRFFSPPEGGDEPDGLGDADQCGEAGSLHTEYDNIPSLPPHRDLKVRGSAAQDISTRVARFGLFEAKNTNLTLFKKWLASNFFRIY